MRGRIGFQGFPYAVLIPGTANSSTAQRLDHQNDRVASKYYPSATSPLTEVDLNVQVGGSLTGINWRVRVESDAADAPSGTVLGTESAEFTISATGWTGFQALGTATGDLSPNVPIWIVLFHSSGSNPTGTNFVGQRQTGMNIDYTKMRHFNGTNWTTTVAQENSPLIAVKHADSRIKGWGYTANQATSAAPDIFGSNRVALRVRFGATFQLPGVSLELFRPTTPDGNLVIEVYEEAVFKYRSVIPPAEIVSNKPHYWFFPQHAPHPGNVDVYIVLKHQTDLLEDTGTSSTDYRLRGYAVETDKIATMLPTNWRHCYGTGDDPTTYTVDHAFLPNLFALVTDLEEDYTSTSLADDWYAAGELQIFTGLNLVTADLRAVLVANGFEFDAAHEFVDEISAHEAAGTARATLSSRTAGVDNTGNYGKIDLSTTFIDFATVTAGQIVRGVAIYVHVGADSANGLLFYKPLPIPVLSDGGTIRYDFASGELMRHD